MRYAILLIIIFLSGCDDDPQWIARAERGKLFEGSKLVKICPNDTYIYKLKDGRYVTRWPWDFYTEIDNVKTICSIM